MAECQLQKHQNSRKIDCMNDCFKLLLNHLTYKYALPKHERFHFSVFINWCGKKPCLPGIDVTEQFSFCFINN